MFSDKTVKLLLVLSKFLIIGPLIVSRAEG